MNERLRDALHRAASGEPGVGDAYARFELARRRANVARGMVVVLVTLAVAASFVYVLPNPFRSGKPAPLHGGGELNPEDSFVNRYTDPTVGFELNYPLSWEGTGSPGGTATFSLPGDGDVFDVHRCGSCTDVLVHPTRFTVRLEPLRAGQLPARARGLKALEAIGVDASIGESFEASGRQVSVYEYVFPDRRDPAFQDWCIDCAVIEFVVRWPGGWVLDVMAMAPDAETMGFYGADARHLVTTIARLIERPYED